MTAFRYLPREVLHPAWADWLGAGADWTWAIGLWGLFLSATPASEIGHDHG